MQSRNFGGFPLGDGTENEGVGVIFGNCIVNDVNTVVGGCFHVFCDVWVIVLHSRYLGSVKGEVRDRWWVTHIEDEVGTETFDELVVALGGGRDNLVTRKLCQLDCVLPNRRASSINKELGVGLEHTTSIGSPIHLPRFQVRVDWRHQVEGA